jgi:hypothetical protein
MSKKSEVRIRLSKIQELSYQCNDILEGLDNEEIESKLKFGLDLNVQAHSKKGLIVINILTTFVFDEEEFLKYKSQLTFNIIGLENIVVKDGNKLQIKDSFLVTLINISIGTVRGLIAKATLGKRINDFPIPIIDPRAILKHISVEIKG